MSKRRPCPDCHKDWGHSYCGTCAGSGFIGYEPTESEMRDEIAERDSILAEFGYSAGNDQIRSLGRRANIAIEREKALEAELAELRAEKLASTPNEILLAGSIKRLLQRAAFNRLSNQAVQLADDIETVVTEIAKLKKVIAEHELCHEDGEVTAECFAKSCIAYQIRKFGRSPTQEEIESLHHKLESYEAEEYDRQQYLDGESRD